MRVVILLVCGAGLFACLGCSNRPCSLQSAIRDSLFTPGFIHGYLPAGFVKEASGLACSKLNPGLLWTHNDSGDSARLYLLTTHGQALGVVSLAGANNKDWEELCLGPGPDTTKSYLYLGDIGDNQERRSYYTIYRVAEPKLDSLPLTAPLGLKNWVVLRFCYPDGPHNTEAMWVEAQTRSIYLLTKHRQTARLYSLPYPQPIDKVAEASYLGALPIAKVTAAALTANGQELLVRTYDEVYYWHRKPHEAIATLLQRPPVCLPYAREPQGEAIAWAADVAGYYTLSERAEGVDPVLYYYQRRWDKAATKQGN